MLTYQQRDSVLTIHIGRALELAGIDRNAFNYLLRGDVLRTSYREHKRGGARRFSWENTLELAFIASQMRLGVSAPRASAYCHEWMAKLRAGTLEKFCIVIADKTGDNYFIGESLKDVMALYQSSEADTDFPTEAAIIYLFEIISRVDDLFGSLPTARRSLNPGAAQRGDEKNE